MKVFCNVGASLSARAGNNNSAQKQSNKKRRNSLNARASATRKFTPTSLQPPPPVAVEDAPSSAQNGSSKHGNSKQHHDDFVDCDDDKCGSDATRTTACSATMATLGSPDDADRDHGTNASSSSKQNKDSAIIGKNGNGRSKSTSSRPSADLSMPTLSRLNSNSDQTYQRSNVTSTAKGAVGGAGLPYRASPSARTHSSALRTSTTRTSRPTAPRTPVTILKTTIQDSYLHSEDGDDDDGSRTTVSTLGTGSQSSPVSRALAAAAVRARAGALARTGANTHKYQMEEASGQELKGSGTTWLKTNKGTDGEHDGGDTQTTLASSTHEDDDRMEAQTTASGQHIAAETEMIKEQIDGIVKRMGNSSDSGGGVSGEEDVTCTESESAEDDDEEEVYESDDDEEDVDSLAAVMAPPQLSNHFRGAATNSSYAVYGGHDEVEQEGEEDISVYDMDEEEEDDDDDVNCDKADTDEDEYDDISGDESAFLRDVGSYITSSAAAASVDDNDPATPTQHLSSDNERNILASSTPPLPDFTTIASSLKTAKDEDLSVDLDLPPPTEGMSYVPLSLGQHIHSNDATADDVEEDCDPIQVGRASPVWSVVAKSVGEIPPPSSPPSPPSNALLSPASDDEAGEGSSELLRGWASTTTSSPGQAPEPEPAVEKEGDEEEDVFDPIEAGRASPPPSLPPSPSSDHLAHSIESEMNSIESESDDVSVGRASNPSPPPASSSPLSSNDIIASNEESAGRDSPPMPTRAEFSSSVPSDNEALDEPMRHTASEVASVTRLQAPSQTKPDIDISSAGLPLLYLGPIDITRQERYSSLGHCVHEAMRLYFKRCAAGRRDSDEGDVLVMAGPSPSVRYNADDYWIAAIPSRGIDTKCTVASRSGSVSVASSQRSWAPVDADDCSYDIRSLSDIRRAHANVALTLKGGQPEEAMAILEDLLRSLQLRQYEQRMERQSCASCIQLVNELNYDNLIEATRYNISVVQIYARQYTAAMSNLQETLKRNSNDVVSSALLGLAMIGANELEDASQVFLEMLVKLESPDMDIAFEGIDDLTHAKGVILNNLASCFLKRKEFERARHIYQRSLDALLVREDSAAVALTLCNLAKTLVQTKEYDTALETLSTSIDYIQNTNMEEHYLTSTMKAKALVAASVKQYTVALQTYEDLLIIFERNKNNEDEILQVLDNMKIIGTVMSKYTESGRTYLRMIIVRQQQIERRKAAKNNAGSLDLLT